MHFQYAAGSRNLTRQWRMRYVGEGFRLCQALIRILKAIELSICTAL
jgi:hypothetical protein